MSAGSAYLLGKIQVALDALVIFGRHTQLTRRFHKNNIDTIAELRKMGLVGPSEAREAVLGENWLRFLRNSLANHA